MVVHSACFFTMFCGMSSSRQVALMLYTRHKMSEQPELQLLCKTPFVGELVLLQGGHEWALLLQTHMLSGAKIRDRALICAFQVLGQTDEVRMQIQTRPPLTIQALLVDRLQQIAARAQDVKDKYVALTSEMCE